MSSICETNSGSSTGSMPISNMATAYKYIATEDPDFATYFGTWFYQYMSLAYA